MPYFSSDGIDLFYQVEGDGPPIVLIHGFASNAHVNWQETGWAGFLRDHGRQVISFDNRGHGKSEKLYDTEVYGADLMAGDVASLIRHLKLGQVDLLGYSMGARISAFTAINHGQLVRSAVFGGLGEAMITGVGGAHEIAQALEAKTAEDIEDPTARAFRAFAEATSSDLLALSACIRSSRAKISREMLSTIKVPVLVAVGGKDELAGRPEPLAQAIGANARALEIPNRDHMRATGDKAFKQGVLDFLNEIGD